MATSYRNETRVAGIRDAAEAFCKAFIAGSPPAQTLSKYFTPNAKIFEHGPGWATERLPFLGTTFQGRRCQGTLNIPTKNTCDDYYDHLTSILSFHPTATTLPPKEEFLLDPQRETVTIKLQAKFASITTGKSWEETFVYILSGFDEDYKIGSQEIWADPLSAWIAVGD